MDEARFEPRQPKGGQYTLTWRNRDGRTRSIQGAGRDISSSGVGIECSTEVKEGSIVRVHAHDGSLDAECEVVHCTRRGDGFRVGFEFRESMKHKAGGPPEGQRNSSEPDYYETLQISRKADMETIHRVFRMMAVRFHPDNSETGDLEQFLRMKQAYAVLSDPARRAAYDATLKSSETEPKPVFALKDFVTGVEAESNRRLGVLCLLYNQRQMNPAHPGVSLLDLERQMGFPREYLTFTMWYLAAKALVTVGDSSDYTMTALGADYVEKKAVRNRLIAQLLNPGGPLAQPSTKTARGRQSGPGHPGQRILLPASTAAPVE